ncbi:MAG: hypothetical protein G01um101466_142, partial [Parcubacteria group bacterium Gr01-1014_66]
MKNEGSFLQYVSCRHDPPQPAAQCNYIPNRYPRSE